MDKQNSRERVAQLFDAYGADTTRWPLSAQHELSGFDPEHWTDLADEGNALDRVVQIAKTEMDATAPSPVLMQRIMAAASTGSRENSKVIDPLVLDQARQGRHRPAYQTANQSTTWHRSAAAAALLAASLVLGIFIGSDERVHPLTLGAGQLAGLNLSTSSQQTVSFDDVLSVSDDEELL